MIIEVNKILIFKIALRIIVWQLLILKNLHNNNSKMKVLIYLSNIHNWVKIIFKFHHINNRRVLIIHKHKIQQIFK